LAAPTLLSHRTEAEAWAARLPDLRRQALRVATAVALGLHGRRRAGQGDSFWQFRPYRAGDPVRGVDWRRSARSPDRPLVREREWQTAETFWLWLDTSPSMTYSGGRARPEKRERAAVLLLTMACLLIRSGERVGLLLPGRLQPLNPSPMALERLTSMLAAGEPLSSEPSASLPPAGDLPRHATVLLFGDAWAGLDEWESRLRTLSAGGARGHLMQVLDPAEVRFPLAGRIRVQGLEGEGSLLLPRAEDLAKRYGERLAGHEQGLFAICRRRDWTFRRHVTDEAPLPALLALHQAIDLGRRAAHA